MKKATFLLFLTLFIFGNSTFSQDKIITKKGKTLNVKILEQNDNVTKYKLTSYPDGPVISMNTRRIKKLVYSDGTEDLLMNVNPRIRMPLGVNFGTALMLNDEGGMFTLNTEYFIIPQISAEADIGTDFESFYFVAGAKFHANRKYTKSGFTPFIGILFGTFYDYTIAQMPFGVNYMAPFGLNVSFSISEMFYFHTYSYKEPYAELKLGWHF